MPRVECVVSQYEERAATGAAKYDIDRTFRHIDASDLPARRAIDEDLSIRNVHIALAIDGNALTATLNKWPQITERAVGAH